MLLLDQLTTGHVTPFNVTGPCVAPKFRPAIVTVVTITPEAGEMALMHGFDVWTPKQPPLLLPPPLFKLTVTGPVVAPFGTEVAMLVLPQVAVAWVPLKDTYPEPWVDPKL